MASRGPQPTPTETLKTRGSWRGKAREKAGEPKLPVERPSCPGWLSKEARAEWRRVVKELERMGVLAKLDCAALAIYCQAWAEYVEMSELLADAAPLIKTSNGNIVQNPGLAVRNRAAETVLSVGARFGFTPADRTRLRATVQEKGGADASSKLRFFAG